MLTFIACAKMMSSKMPKASIPSTTIPTFQKEANEIALWMSQSQPKELEQILRINSKSAIENYVHFQQFHSDETKTLQALFAYNGFVFKRLNVADFSTDDLLYAQDHLRISSFLYGLLRPLDGIKRYRLEGDIKLPELGDKSLFEYWQPKLTDLFIDDIRKQGKGTLINLASEEMKLLFDWNRVKNSVRIITPEFKIIRNGKPVTIVIYTKMARGEMTRYILKNRIEDPEQLKLFSWEGFRYDEMRSSGDNLVFIN